MGYGVARTWKCGLYEINRVGACYKDSYSHKQPLTSEKLLAPNLNQLRKNRRVPTLQAEVPASRSLIEATDSALTVPAASRSLVEASISIPPASRSLVEATDSALTVPVASRSLVEATDSALTVPAATRSLVEAIFQPPPEAC
ncbi:hypothetical protein Bbelb_384980 [Branchiostoma belcheri]|nr:hypothetical protein Bbelb_384980 [Branchiostoma belcheri]